MSARIILCSIALALIGFSCVSQRRHIAEVNERKECLQRESTLQEQLESYSTRLAYKDGQIKSLNEEVNRLDNHNKELQSQLNRLINEATARQEEMEMELQEKVQDLSKKDALINQLQSIREERDQYFLEIQRRLEITLKQYGENDLSYEMTDCCLHLKITDRLLFDANAYQVNQPGTETLGRLAAALRESPDLQVKIIGRTDSLSTPSGALRLNWDFMALRAAAIGRMLTENYGLRPHQITAGARNTFPPEGYSQSAEGGLPDQNIDIILYLPQDPVFDIIRSEDPGN